MVIKVDRVMLTSNSSVCLPAHVVTDSHYGVPVLLVKSDGTTLWSVEEADSLRPLPEADLPTPSYRNYGVKFPDGVIWFCSSEEAANKVSALVGLPVAVTDEVEL